MAKGYALTQSGGNPVSYKEASSDIDGVSTKVISSYASTDTDQQCVDAHKVKLTALGFEWSN